MISSVIDGQLLADGHRQGQFHRKTAPPARHPALRQEARMLAALRHPGVVSLVGDPGDHPRELVLGRVAGGDLEGRSFPAEQVVGIGAGVATTLADLHDLGVVYANCSPAHILLEADGAPVLCSFGNARCDLDHSQLASGQRRDVTALIEVLSGLLDEDRCGLRRLLRRAGRQRHPSARVLARMLAGVDGAQLPAAPDPVGAPAPNETVSPSASATQRSSLPPKRHGVGPRGSDGSRRPRKRSNAKLRWRLGGLALGTVVLGLIVAGAVVLGPSGGRMATVACPAVDAGCGPLPTAAGFFTTPTGQWSLGGSGDVVVLGRWSCTAEALPALLQPKDGQIWVFDRWAQQGTDVTARLVGQVVGATSLVVAPWPNGCDRLVVVGPGSRRTTVDPL